MAFSRTTCGSKITVGGEPALVPKACRCYRCALNLGEGQGRARVARRTVSQVLPDKMFAKPVTSEIRPHFYNTIEIQLTRHKGDGPGVRFGQDIQIFPLANNDRPVAIEAFPSLSIFGFKPVKNVPSILIGGLAIN